jgi:hypothetical protein
VLFVLPLLALYQAIVAQWSVSIPMTIIMIVAGFLFVSVSAYMAGLVGSSNNPVSGMTICTILFAAIVLMLMLGRDSEIGPIAAIMIGAVVCAPPAVGGDNLQDLKCGLSGRRHALEAAGDARHRRDFLRTDHGAGAESAAAGLWHRRRRRRASERARGTAGDPDRLGRERHLRRANCRGR